MSNTDPLSVYKSKHQAKYIERELTETLISSEEHEEHNEPLPEPINLPSPIESSQRPALETCYFDRLISPPPLAPVYIPIHANPDENNQISALNLR